MKLDEIKEILELMREHDLEEVELEQEGVRVRLKRGGVVASAPVRSEAPVAGGTPVSGPTTTTVAAGAPGAGGASDAAAEAAADLAVVTAPIVGTFYRATEPGADPFVEVGDTVKKGQVLCIIEAMKLMNEIDSEYDGQVVNVYADNGQPVQYGERLFAIRPA